MAQVVIENSVLDSPSEEWSRHFYFDEERMIDKVVARSLSSGFIRIAGPKKKGKQLAEDTAGPWDAKASILAAANATAAVEVA
jgi:hypothetical protein